MAESVFWNKHQPLAEQQESLLNQLKALLEAEGNLIANAANLSAALHNILGNFWTGFYFVDSSENNLVLGPFQGPIACTRIEFGKGVCGTVWKEKQTLVVPDVEQFPGHIACSADSKSEVVVPLFDAEQNVMGVLDLDSDRLDFYTPEKVAFAEAAARLFSAIHYR